MGNKQPFEKWEDVPLEKFRANVFRLQRRIFELSRNKEWKQMFRIQKLLLSSFEAKCVAVATVTEENKGRDTSGVDQVRSLTDPAKLRLAGQLSLKCGISPTRRVRIPKPGSPEGRPLGIPTMNDRALQALVVLALEPQHEAHFSPGVYGFRKGRRCQDAIARIRCSLAGRQKWVLDADIEKFFDRVDHDSILRKLNTFPAMRDLVTKMLKAGFFEGDVFLNTETGTPQGGVLSPLLANVALHGMETDLLLAWATWENRGLKPTIAIYADDFVVLHADRAIVSRCEEHFTSWLGGIGLNLHPSKTKIVHTLEAECGNAGFDFLGFHIQQFRTGKYAQKPYFKGIFTAIYPNAKSMRNVNESLAKVIDDHLCGPASATGSQAERVAIMRLNRIIRGWSAYFCHCNGKEAFSKLDYLLWLKVWKALRRRFKARGREWIVNHRLEDGKGQWRYNVPPEGSSPRVELRRFAETAIRPYYAVKSEQSFFDGDWCYWSTRLGRYPSLKAHIGNLMKRQRGRCAICSEKFLRSDVVDSGTRERRHKGKDIKFTVLGHQHCIQQIKTE